MHDSTFIEIRHMNWKRGAGKKLARGRWKFFKGLKYVAHIYTRT
jgi:hypothetical protein